MKIKLGADIAQEINRLVDHLGRNHPKLDQHLLRLMDDFLMRDSEYDLCWLEEDDLAREAPLQDLVSAPVRLRYAGLLFMNCLY